ncbi:MAG: membrane protein insertase YidC [Treponema sp.]|nr:membrane protein insertase YidC [Treponema sp.]
MERNTIIAILLSAVVLVVSLVIEMTVIVPKQQAAAEQQRIEQELEEQKKAELAKNADAAVSTATENGEENSVKETIPEQQVTIKTDKVEATFTNKGGDLISYILLDHIDKDTGKGVQMVDNVTATNRAFALSFGDSNSSIVNEMFEVKRENENTVVFTRDFETKDSLGNPHKFTLLKRYEFCPSEYVFKLGIGIKTYDGNGLNINDAAYTIRTSPQIGPHYDKKNRYEVRQYIAYNEGKSSVKKTFSDKEYNKSYDWAGVGGKYFTILLKPEDISKMNTTVKASTKSESDYQNSQVFYTRNPIEAGSATTVQDVYYVYVGPRSESELNKYSKAETNSWGISNAKFNQAIQTSGFLTFIEIALKWALEMIHRLVKNWGLSIIILTIILRLILFPLSRKSAMGTLKMQQLQPKMAEIQAKYKDNKAKLSEETSKLYKEAGYNPVSGCLPMILQMLILIALYNVFNNYFEFRGSTFIKGWIDDLSVGDSVWSWEKNIPLISSFTQNHLRILPIIYLVSQLLNGKITQFGSGTTQSKGQMVFMMYGLPILFFFLFYNVPSGLLLYWTVSNIFQIGQQLVINATMKKKRLELEKSKPAVNKNVLKFKGGKKKTR